MPNEPAHHGDLSSRVVKLETQFASLIEKVEAMTESMGHAVSKLGAIETRLGSVGKRGLGDILTMVATAAALIGAMWVLAIRPIETRLDVSGLVAVDADNRSRKHDAEINSLQRDLIEIETQFAYMDREDRLLHLETFGHELPPLIWKPR